jgi:signal transduction histidine kinase
MLLKQNLNQMTETWQSIEQWQPNWIGELTHELRTPLTVIRGYLELHAMGALSLTPEVTQPLIEEAGRMERLINDIQEVSKLELGYLSLKLESFEPHAFLTSFLQDNHLNLLINQTLSRNCQIQLDLKPNLPAVWADRDRVKQIFCNLLSNAVRYTPAGTITLTAWQDEQFVWFAVRDTGIGVSEEDLSKIYQQFWRADCSKEYKQEGSGIGLCVTKRLVELLGGTIEVESKLGKGTTFRFCLPLA